MQWVGILSKGVSDISVHGSLRGNIDLRHHLAVILRE